MFKGSSEYMYNNNQNCPLSKNIHALKSHYINVFVNLENKQYKNNKSQYNKRNEQYEMVTWLISWFPFLFYEQFIFIIF